MAKKMEHQTGIGTVKWLIGFSAYMVPSFYHGFGDCIWGSSGILVRVCICCPISATIN